MTAAVKVSPRALSPMVAFGGFAGATIALTAITGWLMSLAFRGPDDGRAIVLSAVVASVIQIAAFPVIRGLSVKNAVVGWASGSLVRFISLPIYAVLVLKVLVLPATAALISLFVFYFLSMLIEPFFLRS